MEITNQAELLAQELRLQRHPAKTRNAWQRWLQHPERFRVRQVLFQIHLWVGAGIGLYVVLMSVTGSILLLE